MRIGLFLSRGNGTISQTVNVDLVAERYHSTLALVKVCDDIRGAADLTSILRDVAEKELDAVVLAGESPLYFERTRGGNLLIERMEAIGVNLNKIAFVNLKEQVALPHCGRPVEATEKAMLLVDVALAKVALSHPFRTVEVTPRRSVAVIGATAGGILVTQALLERGHKVYLIERDAHIGDLGELSDRLAPTRTYVETHQNARLLYSSSILDVVGYAGEYSIRIATPQGERDIDVGAIAIAIGDDPTLTERLRSFFHIHVDAAGFLRALNEDTLPVQTADSGVLLIRPADQGSLSQLIARVDSAALAIDTLLDRSEILHEIAISEVDENVCGGCGTCVKTCIFRASSIDRVNKRSVIDARRCKGCGNCVTACPTGARDLIGYPAKYLFAAVDILSQYKAASDAKVLFLACEGCGYPALDYAGSHSHRYPPGILPLRVRCAGSIDTQLILLALSKGFDGVLICKCQDGHCQNVVGSADLDRRAGLFREVLRSRRIDPERLRILNAADCEGGECLLSAEDFLNGLSRTKGGS